MTAFWEVMAAAADRWIVMGHLRWVVHGVVRFGAMETFVLAVGRRLMGPSDILIGISRGERAYYCTSAKSVSHGYFCSGGERCKTLVRFVMKTVTGYTMGWLIELPFVSFH